MSASAKECLKSGRNKVDTGTLKLTIRAKKVDGNSSTAICYSLSGRSLMSYSTHTGHFSSFKTSL